MNHVPPNYLLCFIFVFFVAGTVLYLVIICPELTEGTYPNFSLN